jgi:cellulose biosynthesis protein BcsQ
MDLGPNLGAINRAALIAANYIVIPLSPDLFSLQGLRNLGPKLWRWREEWRERLEKNPVEELKLPEGRMQPVGYIVLQHSERLDRPVKAYNRWIARIPEVYRSDVLRESGGENILVKSDPYCLSLLKHYRSLMPMAQEARKPLFHLKPADGAIGTHFKAVQEGYKDFEKLAREIARRSGVVIS